MSTHIYPYNLHNPNLQKDIPSSFFPTASSNMQQDHIQHHDSFHHSSSGPASGSQSTNPSSPPVSNLQNQLSMNMFNNMMQIQNVNDQLVNMVGQGSQNANPPNVQYNTQAIFVEQQFKLNQLQQLQQLQNQIFQQQIALISGQSPFISTSPQINRPDILSNLSSLKDTHSNHNPVSSSFTGLPTPGSSSELRPRDGPMEFVTPMVLNPNYMDSPISPHSNHPNENPFSHSHQPPSLLGQQHYNTAPAQVVFQVQSSLGSDPSSPVFNTEDGTPSSAFSGTSVMPSGGDLDLSPITSPWLGAAGSRSQHSRPSAEPSHNQPRSASFSHNLPARSKRPANGDIADHSVDVRRNATEASEPLRKKSILTSPSTLRGHDHPHSQSQSQSTSLNLISQPPQSPLISPTSPFSTNLNSSHLVGGIATSGHNMTSTGFTGPQRKGYRDRVSKSVSNTPLLRGQRSRVASITHVSMNGTNPTVNSGSTTLSPHAFSVKGTNSGKPNTPSTSTASTGANLSTVGFDIGDTPSPVDLDTDMSMPPPAPPEFNANSNFATASSRSRSGSGVGLNPNLGPGMNDMGFGGLSGDQLFVATPAKLMNLNRNAQSSGNGEKGQDNHPQTIQIAHQQPQTGFKGSASLGQDKKTQDVDQDRNTKTKGANDKEKEPGGKGKGSTASAASNTAASRSKRNIAVVPGSMAISTKFKDIQPANPPDANSFTQNVSSRTEQQNQQQPRKTSHKAAEQKRRDSLKSTFDDLRTLLPPIPLPSEMDESAGGGAGVIPGIPGAWPPRSSSQLPGSLPPRGPPKTGAEGPNKGVSKLQLLICGNEYIRVLRARVERRDDEIGRLRNEVSRLRDLLKDLKLDKAGAGENDGDVEMFGGDLGFDSDLDLERDLDAVELHTCDGTSVDQGGIGGGGIGLRTGAASVGVSVNALGSVGEAPDEEDDGD